MVLLETDPETWTPNNTVVTGSDKVLKWDPEVPANCDTDATFDLSHLDYGDPDWDVTVKIYSAGGGLVKTLVEEGGFELGPNTVVWDGMADPIPPADPEPAPKGLYTYTVEAVHDVPMLLECRDTDKSSHLEISGVEFCGWTVNIPTRQIWAKVRYTLNTAAESASLRILSPDFTNLGQVSGLPTTAGTHESDWIELLLPAVSEGAGYYTAVVYATETTAMAEQYNRDRQPKAARQGLPTVEVRPFSRNWRGTDLTWGEGLVQNQETVHRAKRYQAYATVGMPDDDMLEFAFYNSALMLLENHAGPGYQEIADDGWVVGQRFDGFQPDIMLALEDLEPLHCRPLHFVAFVGCKTAQDGGQFGWLTEDAVDAGANAALGFRELISGGEYVGVWVAWFYYYACVSGLSVTEAAACARDWVFEVYEEFCGYDSYEVAGDTGCTLVPARYGFRF